MFLRRVPQDRDEAGPQTCPQRASYVRHRHGPRPLCLRAFDLLRLLNVLMPPPLSLWADNCPGERNYLLRLRCCVGPVPVLRPLSGASIICTQLSPQPVPGADRHRPITDQPGFGSGQSVEASSIPTAMDSHASIPTPPQSLPPSCLILVLSLGNRSLSSRPTH